MWKLDWTDENRRWKGLIENVLVFDNGQWLEDESCIDIEGKVWGDWVLNPWAGFYNCGSTGDKEVGSRFNVGLMKPLRTSTGLMVEWYREFDVGITV